MLGCMEEKEAHVTGTDLMKIGKCPKTSGVSNIGIWNACGNASKDRDGLLCSTNYKQSIASSSVHFRCLQST